MAEALKPELTKFDRRVLAALGEESLGSASPYPWMSAWAVAEAVQEDDVALIRRVLHGLEDFGYAWHRGFPPKQQWIRRRDAG